MSLQYSFRLWIELCRNRVVSKAQKLNSHRVAQNRVGLCGEGSVKRAIRTQPSQAVPSWLKGSAINPLSERATNNASQVLRSRTVVRTDHSALHIGHP